jgi:hypothetical protein
MANINPEDEKDPQDERENYGFTNFEIISHEDYLKRKNAGIIASYGGDRENQYGDSHLINISTQIDGKECFTQTSVRLELKQKISGHHEFELTCDPEEFEKRDAYLLQNSKYLLGKRITFQFRQFGKTASFFTGIITQVSNQKNEGIHHILIKGKSPSILLENGLHCRSFENKTLEEIIKEVIKDYPQDLISFNINPINSNNKDRIKYLCQYQETDFSFLKRLGNLAGEYFFYNGSQFMFSPSGGYLVELTEGEDFYNYQLKLEVQPQKFSYTAYDAQRAETHTINSQDKTVQRSDNFFQQTAFNA